MKILQLVTKRQYRGAEVFAANLSTELLGFGHSIVFAGLYKNNSDILKVEGAKNLDLHPKKSSGFSPIIVQSLAKLVNREKPDVVQCNGSDTLKYMVAASYFSKRVPITYRNISTISEWIDSSLKLYTYKILFKRVDHVTSVGSESIRDLITTLSYPEEKTSVIRRGISIKSFSSAFPDNLRKELGFGEKEKIVMHIGNFSPEKNHEFLLDVFTRIKKENPEIKLVCVGEGVTFQTIRQQIKKQDLEDTVFLLGFRKDIPELLAQADCFALASKIEGVPGVILEAASQRVPTVATKVGGVPEVLIHEKTGFIIDDFDKKEFQKRLISLVTNSELNKKLGENAFNLVQKEFNPLSNALKFEKLYARLAHPSLVEKNQLRILQIIQKKQFRGAEVFASQLGNHFQKSGHIVKILSIYDGEARLPFSGEIESLNRNKTRRTFDPVGWRKLSSIINKFEPDIVQANASDTLKYAVMSKYMFGWNAPLIYRNASTSSFYMKTAFARNINSFLLKKVDLIISVSHASLKDLNSLFPFTQKKSLMIPVGVEENSAPKGQHSESPFRKREFFNLIHIGSFTREKNHMALLRIFKNVLAKDDKMHLNLIGSGPLMSEIKYEVNRMGIETKVNFLGDIENPQIYISHASALLLPSLVEGLPGVILEAMYNKTPVVAYDVGGVSEVITNNKTGKLIVFNDEISFSNAVLELKNNKDQRDSIVNDAYEVVKKNFLNSGIQEAFLRSYKSLIK